MPADQEREAELSETKKTSAQQRKDAIFSECKTFRRCCDMILEDINKEHEKITIYNIDFALMYPYLWDSPVENIRAPYISNKYAYDFVGKSIFRLLEETNTSYDFSFALSTPSFYELIESIYHQVERIDRSVVRKDFFENIERRVDSWSANDWSDLALRGEDAASVLQDVSHALRIARQNISGNVQKIADLIRERHAIHGVSDFVDRQPTSQQIADFQQAYAALLARMNAVRRHHDTRDSFHRDFHYKVDCANIALSGLLNKWLTEYRVQFVCRSGIRKAYMQDKGRSPLVPFFRLQLHKLYEEQKNPKRESEAHIDSMRSALIELESILDGVHTIHEATLIEQQKIINFYHTYVSPAFGVEPWESALTQGIEEDINYILTNKSNIIEKSELEKQLLIDIGQKIVKDEPNSDLDRLLEKTDFYEDAHLNGVFKKLNIDFE